MKGLVKDIYDEIARRLEACSFSEISITMKSTGEVLSLIPSSSSEIATLCDVDAVYVTSDLNDEDRTETLESLACWLAGYDASLEGRGRVA